MLMMSISIYYAFPQVTIVSFVLANFGVYFGNQAIFHVYVTELGEPFVIGIGTAVLWIFKSLVAFLIPFLYSNYPIYYTPALSFAIGGVLFIFMRPL